MNKSSFIATSILAAGLFLNSCTSGKNGGNAGTEADSIQSEPAEQEKVITALPDSALPSADRLEYKIDAFEPEISGELGDLKDLYTNAPGILTFRGGPRRNADFKGHIQGRPDSISIEWTFKTEFRGEWGGGTGWTGQPLYVNWPDSCRKMFKESAKEEIMVGSLCGKVYFIDYETGKISRQPIDVSNPIKGTMMLDPLLNGRLYVGQGVPVHDPFGALTIDLYSHSIAKTYPKDPKAWRGWGAYDSSPVRIGSFVFRPGENGTLYKFYIENGEEKLHSTLRFRKKGMWGAGGVEASMAVFANYGYLADNHGNVVCVNLETLKPIWHYDNKDDNDATPVIEEEDGMPFVYCGCEVDRQAEADSNGTAHFVKLNGLTGEEVWHFTEKSNKAVVGSKHFDGGFYCTPLLGGGNCSNLIFTNIVLNTDKQNGCFIALDRKTGKQVYSVKLKHYAWSSPVAFYNEKDEMFVFAADTYGYVYLIEGKTGNILFTKKIGMNFESSPAVIGNHLVVGTRGDQIFKMKVESRK